MIEIIYNGFHGRNSFRVRTTTEEIAKNSSWYFVNLTPRQIARINRIVGCKTHNTVFGVRYKIPGACGCGEGINTDEPVRARQINETIYEIRGRYPQN
jgi:hypothetical protein